MPWKAISPLEIYKLLPRTNCKECGEENCMAFSAKLVNMETKLEACSPLFKDPKYRENLEKIRQLIRPLVREITLFRNGVEVKIGGEYVMMRHELTYVNPTPIAIDVDDEMSEEQIASRVDFVNNFKYEYIGRTFYLDLLCVRSVTNDPKSFAKAVRLTADKTDKPLILCSKSPKVIEAGIKEIEGSTPLLYAATEENWYEMSQIAKRYSSPLAIFSPGDLDKLLSLVKTLRDLGLEDLALDPGTFVGDGFGETINNFTMLRWKACNEDDELCGYPLIGVPLTSWLTLEGDAIEKAWWETVAASILMDRYADLLIMHSAEGWVMLPLVIQRFNLYTDPRKPVAVNPGLRVIGNPGENSPVFVTGNFALTYYLVSGDIESAKIDSYLLVTDTEGIAVECAVPGRRMSPERLAEILESSTLKEKVKHRILVIPGKAARLAGDIEDATGWKVVVGPQDSKDIAAFMQTRWKKVLEEG